MPCCICLAFVYLLNCLLHSVVVVVRFGRIQGPCYRWLCRTPIPTLTTVVIMDYHIDRLQFVIVQVHIEKLEGSGIVGVRTLRPAAHVGFYLKLSELYHDLSGKSRQRTSDIITYQANVKITGGADKITASARNDFRRISIESQLVGPRLSTDSLQSRVGDPQNQAEQAKMPCAYTQGTFALEKSRVRGW